MKIMKIQHRAINIFILTVIMGMLLTSCAEKVDEPGPVIPHNPKGIEVMQVKFENDLTLHDDSTDAAFTGFEWDYTNEPLKIFPVAYSNNTTVKAVVDLKTDGTFSNDTWVKIYSVKGEWTGGAMAFAAITPESALVSSINGNTTDFTCTGGAVQGIDALAMTLKWSIHYRKAGETTWQPLQGEAGEERIQNTTHNVYVTKGTPFLSPIWAKVAAWSCTWAKGLIDDKQIADAIIQNISGSGLHYGQHINGDYYKTVRELLSYKYGMCAAWGRFYNELCAIQGVEIKKRHFLIQADEIEDKAKWDTTGHEVKWISIIIQSPGINNNTCQFLTYTNFRLVDKIYRWPAYYGDNSTTDQVDYVTGKNWYQFWAPNDGHALCFLDYGGNNYLYDPSFKKEPYENVYPSIPSNDEHKRDAENAKLRQLYYNAYIDHHKGYVYSHDENWLPRKFYFDVKTSLFQDDETLHLLWKEY